MFKNLVDRTLSGVMAGLDPAIHGVRADGFDHWLAEVSLRQGLRPQPHAVDAKVKPWHDDIGAVWRHLPAR